MNAVNDKCCTPPSAVGVRVLGSRIPIMDACFCGFIRGLLFGTSPFFHVCAHGRADARFHLGAFRSEIPPIPTPTPGPSCTKADVGAWEVARADTPYRGRPAPRAARVQRAPGRGGEGVGPCRIRTRPARPFRVRAISLRNAPRRQRASPRGRGGSMVDPTFHVRMKNPRISWGFT